MKYFYKIFFIFIIVALIGAIVFGGVAMYVRGEYMHKIYPDITVMPADSTLVVLGASVINEKTPSAALEDRLEMAVRAWRAGKVEKIILSGDDGRWAQPEISAMLAYLREQEVPDTMLILDGNNARTFDSCYRLRNELIQKDVVLITQSFHLPRALYLCNEMGLDAYGLASDLRWYQSILWFTLRDWGASVLAWYDIYTKQLPTYLKKEAGLPR